MFFKSENYNFIRDSCRYKPLMSLPFCIRHFVITNDGMYFATDNNSVVLKSKKVAKFNGKVCFLKSLENIVIAGGRQRIFDGD